MKNLIERKNRYLQDAIPTRLGGLAANLARVSSFSQNSANKESTKSLLEESKYFIEWTATETDIQTSAKLVELQIQLSRWELTWDKIWNNEEIRSDVGKRAKEYSNQVLQNSGLLDGK